MAVNSIIIPISSTQITNQTDYSSKDKSLISTIDLDTTLDSTSYIEYNIYDLSNRLLFNTYTYVSYTVLNDGQSALSSNINQINIDPEKDLENLGYNQGGFNVYYNIL